MDKRVSLFLAVFAVAAVGFSSVPHAQLFPSVVACRHDDSALQTDRARREQAVTLARAINAAQGTLSQQTRRYHALMDLPNLPEVPDGFELSFYSDNAGYIFSLKDTSDPCRHAIFSDEAGLLYEQSGRSEPVLAPL
jgi:hypothetical protein